MRERERERERKRKRERESGREPHRQTNGETAKLELCLAAQLLMPLWRFLSPLFSVSEGRRAAPQAPLPAAAAPACGQTVGRSVGRSVESSGGTRLPKVHFSFICSTHHHHHHYYCRRAAVADPDADVAVSTATSKLGQLPLFNGYACLPLIAACLRCSSYGRISLDTDGHSLGRSVGRSQQNNTHCLHA